MLLLGLTVAMSAQIVGTPPRAQHRLHPARPGDARHRLTPRLVNLLSVVFAVGSVIGGILLALDSSVPIRPYVTTIAFAIYLVCRLVGARRSKRGPAGRR
jgi:zinc/manganese transport system permease protein